MMFCSSFFSIPTFLFMLCYLQCWLFEATAENCSKYSGMSCKDCVDVSGCFYCEPTKVCEEGGVVKSTLQKSCKDQEWMTGQCVVSGRVLLIALPVTGFVVLVALGCCIYCCCCRKRKARGGTDKEEAKSRKKRKDIAMKHKEREMERQEKRDEIRKKYGLQAV